LYFHVIERGSCALQLDGACGAIRLETGDAVILPHGHAGELTKSRPPFQLQSRASGRPSRRGQKASPGPIARPGIGEFGAPCAKWGLWHVLQQQLGQSTLRWSSPSTNHREPKIDPGGNSAATRPIAVDDRQ
jgi:hypothetical protein